MIFLKRLKDLAFILCTLTLLTSNVGNATALIDAVKSGNLNRVEALLKSGVNVNEQDDKGMTPLMRAVLKNNKEIVELLLKHNPNLNIQNNDGWTALIIAVALNNKEIVELLLKHNPDLNIQDMNGNTALIVAVTKNKEIVELLLKHNPDLNIQNKEGNTALILAVHKNNIAMVKLLLEHNPDLNIPTNFGQTALMLAAKDNNKEIVNLLYSFSHVKSPQNSCYLPFEQKDETGLIADGLLYAILMNVLTVCSSTLLEQLFSYHPFITEYFETGKFTVLTDEIVGLVVIIPEPLTNLNIIIPEPLKQKDLISKNSLEEIVHIEKTYGFKNLNLINPPFVTTVIKEYGTKKFEASWLIEHFAAIIDTSNANHPTRFYLYGHGGPNTIIAGIPLSFFDKFLDFLSAIGTEFLFINTCHAAGTNLLKMQSDLGVIITDQIAQQPQRIKEYKEKLKEYEQLMKNRIEAEPQKYGDIDTYRKLYPEPIMPFIGINYAIVIQATSETTIGTGNINAMFTKLNEFLKDPAWALEFARQEDKPKITITDVIASLGIKVSMALPSIRMPGKTGFFRSINIGNMAIITASRLIEAGVERTLALIAETKSSDISKADEAKRKLKEPLAINIAIKPDIRFIQIFPIDLTDFIFDIQGTLVPNFISKLPDTGQHFIGGITSKLPLDAIINQGFVNIFKTEYSAETRRCWFVKSVDLATTHIKKLAILLNPALAEEKKAYIGSHAYINEKGEYIISQEGKPESKIDKKTYELTVGDWSAFTLPSQATLTEATGGVETTDDEKERLKKEKGGTEALQLIEPRFARTPYDLFRLFMAE